MAHTDPSDGGTEFAIFRRTGDPDALAAVFDATAPRLLRLALRLTSDPAAAEDLVQATFLAAMERAAEHDAGRRLLPWLCGILEIEAKRARRAAARRPDPDRLAASRPCEPVDAAAADELRATIDSALNGLPRDYRTVVTLRVVHGLSPAAIAAALERPPVTVRSQLHRGLRMLRASLPAGVATTAAFAVALPARGLAAVRDRVLAECSVHAITEPIVWSLWMTKKKLWLGALGAAALAVAAVSTWSDPRSAPASVGESSAAPFVRDSAPGLEPARVPSASVVGRESVPAADRSGDEAVDERPGSVRVAVTTAGGEPVAGVGVRVVPDDGRRFGLHGRLGFTGADGVLRIDDVSPGRVLVRLDREARVRDADPDGERAERDVDDRWARRSVAVRPAATTDVEFVAAPGFELHGIVVGPDGEPAPGAEIWCAPFTAPPHAADLVARADAAGRFVLASVGPSHWFCARRAGSAPSRTFSPWRGSEGRTGRVEVRLELGTEAAGGAIDGVIVDAAGRRVDGAEVVCGRSLFDGEIDRREAGIWTTNAAPMRLTTDASGRFRAAGVAAGAQTVRVRAAGFEPIEVTCDVAGGGRRDAERTIVLRRGFTIAGRLVDRDGAAVRGVRVVASRAGGDGEAVLASSRSGADGRYRLDGLAADAEPVRVTTDSRRYGVESAVVPAGAISAGRSRELNFELTAFASLVVRVVDASSRPLAHWRVEARPDAAPSQRGVGAMADERGRVTLRVDPRRRYTFGLTPPSPRGRPRARIECAWLSPFAIPAEVDGRPAELELVVPANELAFGGIVGRLRPAAAGGVRFYLGERERRAWSPIDADGSFSSGALEPGSYRAVFEPGPDEDAPSFVLGTVAVTVGRAVDLGALTVPSPATLVASVRGAKDGDAPTLHGYVLTPDGREVGMLTGHDGVAHERLAPGRYRIESWALVQYGGTRLFDAVDVELIAGREVRIELDLATSRAPGESR